MKAGEQYLTLVLTLQYINGIQKELALANQTCLFRWKFSAVLLAFQNEKKGKKYSVLVLVPLAVKLKLAK